MLTYLWHQNKIAMYCYCIWSCSIVGLKLYEFCIFPQKIFLIQTMHFWASINLNLYLIRSHQISRHKRSWSETNGNKICESDQAHPLFTFISNDLQRTCRACTDDIQVTNLQTQMTACFNKQLYTCLLCYWNELSLWACIAKIRTAYFPQFCWTVRPRTNRK